MASKIHQLAVDMPYLQVNKKMHEAKLYLYYMHEMKSEAKLQLYFMH